MLLYYLNISNTMIKPQYIYSFSDGCEQNQFSSENRQDNYLTLIDSLTKEVKKDECEDDYMLLIDNLILGTSYKTNRITEGFSDELKKLNSLEELDKLLSDLYSIDIEQGIDTCILRSINEMFYEIQETRKLEDKEVLESKTLELLSRYEEIRRELLTETLDDKQVDIENEVEFNSLEQLNGLLNSILLIDIDQVNDTKTIKQINKLLPKILEAKTINDKRLLVTRTKELLSEYEIIQLEIQGESQKEPRKGAETKYKKSTTFKKTKKYLQNTKGNLYQRARLKLFGS